MAELRDTGLSWGEAQAAAKDRTLWRNIVVAWCTTGDEEDKKVLFSKEHTIIIFSMIIRIFLPMLRGPKIKYDGYINVLMLTRIVFINNK